MCHIMTNLQYYTKNYVDDFMGIEIEEVVWNAYSALGHLLRDLGVKETEDKSVSLNTVIEFLGTRFNLITLEMFITVKKLHEIQIELERWIHQQSMTRDQLESLIGKLQAVSNCVRPTRLYISQLANKLPDMRGNMLYIVDETMQLDIKWWRRFIPMYNGRSIMWMEQMLEPDAILATDACLTGIGGQCGRLYFHEEIPVQITEMEDTHIAHYELNLNPLLSGLRFKILCDNQVVSTVLNTAEVGTANYKNYCMK